MRATAMLGPDLASPRLARRWLADRLPATVPQSLRDDAALLISELVTNSVLHAMTSCLVTIDLSDRCLRVVVADREMRGPASIVSNELGESGRGMEVVAGLASKWGWRRTEGGKEIWFELPFDD
jgi:anti-sigma regulatory factor (Ser/Thr protein kinase)